MTPNAAQGELPYPGRLYTVTGMRGHRWRVTKICSTP